MYKICLDRLVVNLIEKRFNVHIINWRSRQDESSRMIFFEMDGLANESKDFVSYSGYIGSVGDVVVTWINGEALAMEDFIKLT